MNIAMIGYGRMGREIAQVLSGEGPSSLSLIVDPNESGDVPAEAERLGVAWASSVEAADFSGVDVAIEFTHPSVVMENMAQLMERGVSTVVGTTGWTDRIDEVRQQVERSGAGLLWASNFSIGVHLFWKMVERGAQLMNAFESYDVFGHEFHHNKKADSPSGTARSTAQIVLDHVDRKTTLVPEMLDRPPRPEELHFSSTRGGSVPGTHSVYFDSDVDTIELTHTARGRKGFAVGSVRCAEWLKGRSGFFSIEDYLEDFLSSNS